MKPNQLPTALMVVALSLLVGLTVGYAIRTWRGVRLAERRAAYRVVPPEETLRFYGRPLHFESPSSVNSLPVIRKERPTAPDFTPRTNGSADMNV